MLPIGIFEARCGINHYVKIVDVDENRVVPP